MERCLIEHSVYEQVQSLSELTTTHGLTAHLKKQWEGVDQDILRASLHAENWSRRSIAPPGPSFCTRLPSEQHAGGSLSLEPAPTGPS
jgi:hypothetical protein